MPWVTDSKIKIAWKEVNNEDQQRWRSEGSQTGQREKLDCDAFVLTKASASPKGELWN